MTTNKIEDRERGQWTSASNAAADALCPGRHLAQQGLPDTRSDDASFGDGIHARLAGDIDLTLTPEQESIVESCLEIEEKVLVKYFPETAADQLVSITEKRWWVEYVNTRHSGQLDRVHRLGTKALIIEWKSLPGELPAASSNMQLRDQACLLWCNMGMINQVATVVIQPLVTHDPEICVYTKANMEVAMMEMKQRVLHSNQPDAPRAAGEVQCKFCRAKSQCATYQQWAGSLVPAPRTLVDTPVAEWTPEQRKLFCDNYGMAQKWLNHCWEEMERLATLDPNAVPGYHMEEGSPRSTIINLQAVFDRFSKEGGSLADFMNNATISKKSLKDMLAVATKRKGKALDETVKLVVGPDFKLSEVKKSLVKI